MKGSAGENRWINVVVVATVASFGIALVDYCLFRQIGIRILPVSYGTLRWLVAGLGGVAALAAFWVYGPRRTGPESGFYSLRVCPYRIVSCFAAIPLTLTVASFFGRWSWLLELTCHFPVQYAVTLGVAAFVLLLGKRYRAALIAGSFSLANVVVVFPQIGPRESPAGSGPTLKLALANVNSTNRRYATLRESVRLHAPHILVLEEVSPSWLAETRSLKEQYPYGLIEPQTGNFGIGLMSRVPLESCEIVHLANAGLPSVTALVQVEGHTVLIVGTHPLPPRDGTFTRLRDGQLMAAAELVRGSASEVVVLGDLNTTPWSPSFRRLLQESGLRDSSRGWGLRYTWPAGIWPLGIPVDHCLISKGIDVVRREVGPHVGSDHYPLIVDIVLPQRRGH